MLRTTALLTALVVATFTVEKCQAQRVGSSRVPTYTQRPVISPYVNLFNNNQGGVNNYFSLVRPMQMQQQINQQQFLQNRYLHQQLMQPSAPTSGPLSMSAQGMLRPSNPGVGQPSTAAGYFNYSHFYNMPSAVRRR